MGNRFSRLVTVAVAPAGLGLGLAALGGVTASTVAASPGRPCINGV